MHAEVLTNAGGTMRIGLKGRVSCPMEPGLLTAFHMCMAHLNAWLASRVAHSDQ